MLTELNVSDPLFVIVQFAPLMVIVPFVGASVTDGLMVRGPAIEKLAVGCVAGVEATVNPLNVSVPELATAQLLPVMVTVPAVGAKVWLLFTVSVPLMPKLVVGCVDGVPAIVRSANVKVPVFATVQFVPDIVIAPLVGVNVPETFRAPVTVALLLAPVIDPLIFRLL